MPKFKYIIFDWSGVINDSIENYFCVVNKMFKELGVKEISLEELKENYEQPYMRFYNKYLPNLTMEEQRSVYKKFVSERPKGKPYPGIVNILKEFKRAGIKMAILSSDLPETFQPEIKSFGLEGIFIDVITDVHDKSEGIYELIERNNFKKEETIFIGDSNHEIEEGKSAGVKTGAVTWGFSTAKRLKDLNPDFLIRDLDNLKSVIL